MRGPKWKTSGPPLLYEARIAAVMSLHDSVAQTIAREVKSGTFTPRVHVLDTHSGVMKWVPNPALRALIPAHAQQLVDSLAQQMHAGTFTAPR